MIGKYYDTRLLSKNVANMLRLIMWYLFLFNCHSFLEIWIIQLGSNCGPTLPYVFFIRLPNSNMNIKLFGLIFESFP